MASTLGGTAALVTGASSGIGAATARQLAEQGAAVALVARRKDRLDTLVADIEQAGGTALAVEADISDRTQAEAAVQQAAERFGRLDTLVNNAGLMLLGPIVGADPEEWDRMTAVNVEGLLYSTRAALPHLLRADYAAGLYRATRPGGRWHLYCFSGGNINGMTAPMGAAPVVVEAMLQGLGTIAQNIRDTLTANGWLINYFGPTTYLGDISAFIRDVDDLPEQQRAKVSPGTLEQMRGINNRFATVANLIDDGRVYLPFTVVHAERVD